MRCLVYLLDTWCTYGSLVVLVEHVAYVRVVCCTCRTRGARTGGFICLYYMLCTYGSLGMFVKHVWVAWYAFRHVVHVPVACRTSVVGLVCLQDTWGLHEQFFQLNLHVK